MTLKEYLKNEGLVIKHFAEKTMGVTEQTLHNWLGGGIPSSSNIKKISRITKGAVSPSDWF